MVEYFKIKNMKKPVTTTEMVKIAKQELKANREVGIDKEIKIVDLNNSFRAWDYLLTIGIGINEGQKWTHSSKGLKLQKAANKEIRCKECGNFVSNHVTMYNHEELCADCFHEWVLDQEMHSRDNKGRIIGTVTIGIPELDEKHDGHLYENEDEMEAVKRLVEDMEYESFDLKNPEMDDGVLYFSGEIINDYGEEFSAHCIITK